MNAFQGIKVEILAVAGISTPSMDSIRGTAASLKSLGTSQCSFLYGSYTSTVILSRYIEKVTGLPVYFVRALRNTFDTVATMVKYSGASPRDRAGGFFSICGAVRALRERVGPKRFIDIRNEALT